MLMKDKFPGLKKC